MEIERSFRNYISESKRKIQEIERETEKKLGELLNEYVSECDITLYPKWANLNKNEDLDTYMEEVKKGDYYIRKSRCVLVLDFPEHSEAYDWLCKNLLTDIPLLNRMGGCTTEEQGDELKMIQEKWDNEWAYHVTWYNTQCVLVRLAGEDKFVIDPQGYSYARYVGLL